jgi:hypothetical protein
MKTDQLLLDQRGDRLPSDYIAAAGKSSEPSGENQTEESAARRVISIACGSLGRAPDAGRAERLCKSKPHDPTLNNLTNR